MSNAVDLTKPLLYNDLPVQLISDKMGFTNDLALIYTKDGHDYIMYCPRNSPFLKNVPPAKVSHFKNIYKSTGGWDSYENAKKARGRGDRVFGVLETITDADTGELIDMIFHKE